MLYDLSVVIPSYNGADALRQTLASLVEGVPEAEIIVVDGGSSDGSQDVAREYGVCLLEVHNYGFGHNINRGIEKAKGWYVAMINSDVIISRNTIEKCLERLQDSRVGALGPTPIKKNGKRQQSFSALYFPNYLNFQEPLEVNMLHGYCMFTRKDVLERVGGFDERFFLYNEEYDWCWRVLKAGFSLEMIPETAIHFEGASTRPSLDIFLEGRRGGVFLIKKHFPAWISEPTRRLFQLEAWLGSMFSHSREHREAWLKLERWVKSERYFEGTLPLSGRSEMFFRKSPQ